MPSTIPTTLPTLEELDAAIAAFKEPVEQLCQIQWRVHRLADWNEEGWSGRRDEGGRRQPGDEVPTFEQIGQLFSFVTAAESRLEEARGYVENVRDDLRELDMVREQDG